MDPPCISDSEAWKVFINNKFASFPKLERLLTTSKIVIIKKI